MLLNLTNHPSAGWPENQRDLALAMYQEIVDLSFPVISPSSTETDITQLVLDYLNLIQALHPTAVHVMGEMTFSFQLIYRLLALGIPCVASTTQRITSQVGDTKISKFEFVRFRAYSLAEASV